jgi:hypothetical protein
MNDEAFPPGRMVLGKQLPNPYEISVMRQAFKNLKASGVFKGKLATLTEEDIMPTDSYEQYLPYSHEDADLMRADTSLLFFDYPLDYEIEEDGTYYHDPAIPADQPSFLYAVQPKMTPITLTARARLEKRAELYIPEHDPEFGYRYKAAGDGVDFAAALELEAMRLVGLPVPKDEKTGGPVTKSSRWYPSGSVRIAEPGHSAEKPLLTPMAGVKVVFNSYLRISQAITRADGTFNYSGPGFLFKVRYRIKWESSEFDLRDGCAWKINLIGWSWEGCSRQAYTGKSGSTKDAWNKVFEKTNGKEYFHANVFRTAYFNWFEQTTLERPTRKAKAERKVKFNLFHEKAPRDYDGQYEAIGPIKGWINLFVNNPEGIRYTAMNLTAIAFHEIAHVSHHQKNRNQFHLVAKRHAESWAVFYEWHLTPLFFGSIRAKHPTTAQLSDFEYNPQGLGTISRQTSTKITDPGSISGGYTPFFVDLLDDYNQGSYEDNVVNLLAPIDLEREVVGQLDFKTSLFQSRIMDIANSKGQSTAYSTYWTTYLQRTGY